MAQERFFNANRQSMEAQGVNVDEFNKASKGKNLPPKAKKPETKDAKRIAAHFGGGIP